MSTWAATRLRRVMQATGGSWGAEPDDGDVVAACLRGTDFDMTRLRANLQTAPTRGFAREEFNRRRLKKGDLIIEKSGGGDYQPVGRVVLFDGDEPAVPTNFAARLRPEADTESRFLCYLMASLYSDGRTRSAIKQTTGIQNLDVDALLDESVPIPGFLRQRAIADFLDAETARIDSLIAKKSVLSSRINEHCKSATVQLMMFGLQPSTEVRNTGNPFIPVVPAHWELLRLRHVVTDIIDTAHKTAPVVEGGEFPVVRTANVRGGRLDLSGAKYTDKQSWVEWTRRGRPLPNDVLFTREAPAGEACLVPSGPPLCIGQRMVLLRVRRDALSPVWLLHSLYAGPAEQFIAAISRATTVPHMNMSDIPDIPILRPPLHEQDRILTVVRLLVARAAALTDILTRQISLLQEHRQALITAAVTGELAIPSAA